MNASSISDEAYGWIVRFMAGGMSPADMASMKAWYRQSPDHRAAYAEARRVWQSLGPIASESRHRPGEGQVARAAPSRTGAASIPSRRLFLGGALAASAAVLMVRPPLDLWPSYTELMADFRTGAGERQQIALGDSLSLDLNTRSSIAIRTQTAEATRIEMLSGEAAISNGRGAPPLTVVAGTGRIFATDAELNVRCDGGEVIVTCLKGHLDVARDGQTTPLDARQQVAYGRQQTGAVAGIDPAVVTAWQQGVLTFDATPVAQVIAELNRYRPGRIILVNGDIGRRLLNARIKVAETDKIIVQIVHIFGAKARELPGGVVILS
jgi:transmembrane sensor